MEKLTDYQPQQAIMHTALLPQMKLEKGWKRVVFSPLSDKKSQPFG
jgi:hypothetical protein